MSQDDARRARLQARILASTIQVDDRQACLLLGLPATDTSATMQQKEAEGEVLRLEADGQGVYPLFQFDVDRLRIFPIMARVIAAKPPRWSNYRLVHWLLSFNSDLGSTPADAIALDGDAVLDALARDAEVPSHG